MVKRTITILLAFFAAATTALGEAAFRLGDVVAVASEDEMLCLDWCRMGCIKEKAELVDDPYLNPVKFPLQHLYIECDGMPVDPNWYDLWASARYEDGKIWIDRLTFRRIKPPNKTGGQDAH